MEHLVAIFRETHRVLRSDGTLWVVIGDSFWGGKGRSGYELPHEAEQRRARGETLQHAHNVPGYLDMRPTDGSHPVLKNLDLCMIPARFAIAMVEDGWYLRQEITYAKKSPMPESVEGWRWERHRIKTCSAEHEERLQELCHKHGTTRVTEALNVRKDRGEVAKWVDCPGCTKCAPNDGLVLRKGSWRPTSATEKVFIFSKTDSYYMDGEDVRVPLKESSIERGKYGWHGNTDDETGLIAIQSGGGLRRLKATGEPMSTMYNSAGANMRNWLLLGPEPFDLQLCAVCKKVYDKSGCRKLKMQDDKRVCTCGATDWVSHFAAFVSEIPRIAVKAGTSAKGCCPKCGAPWVRVLEQPKPPDEVFTNTVQPSNGFVSEGSWRGGGKGAGQKLARWFAEHPSKTLGWRPSCTCASAVGVSSAIILDPFCGTGTVVAVAEELGRIGIGLDLSADYLSLAQARCERWKPRKGLKRYDPLQKTLFD